MVDEDQIAMLVYSHVVQLTLIDYEPAEAFLLAHRVAARAFDAEFTLAGLKAAKAEFSDAAEAEVVESDGNPQPPESSPAEAPVFESDGNPQSPETEHADLGESPKRASVKV